MHTLSNDLHSNYAHCKKSMHMVCAHFDRSVHIFILVIKKLNDSWKSIETATFIEASFVNEYYYKGTAPLRELASFIIVILPFSRVHSVCISPDFYAHGAAKLRLYLLSVGNRKACISAFPSKYRLFNSGGQRGILSLIANLLLNFSIGAGLQSFSL